MQASLGSRACCQPAPYSKSFEILPSGIGLGGHVQASEVCVVEEGCEGSVILPWSGLQCWQLGLTTRC